MYKINVPYHTYTGKAGNKTVHFMLETKDVFKNYVELNDLFTWRDELGNQTPRDLEPHELVTFFNNFETILLAAYGVPSADGEVFDRTDRYNFEQSAVFSAFMDMLLSDIAMVNQILIDIMPKGMEEMVKKQVASLEGLKEQAAKESDPAARAAADARIQELEAKLKEAGVSLSAAPELA